MKIERLEQELLNSDATPAPWTYDAGDRVIREESNRSLIADISDYSSGEQQRTGYYNDDGLLIVALRNNAEKILAVLKAAKQLADEGKYRTDGGLEKFLFWDELYKALKELEKDEN